MNQRQGYKDYYYLKGNKILDNNEIASICEPSDSKRACARLAINVNTNAQVYYIKMVGGNIVDPYVGDVANVGGRAVIKYKKVNEEIFKKYVTYLQTGTSFLFRQIVREIPNG